VHAHKLLHLDIKPSNIYLRNDGTPVLLDFGAARQTLMRATRRCSSRCTPRVSPRPSTIAARPARPVERHLQRGRQHVRLHLSAAPRRRQPISRVEKDTLIPSRWCAGIGQYSDQLLKPSTGACA
jgi:serine/threonine protein kinase